MRRLLPLLILLTSIRADCAWSVVAHTKATNAGAVAGPVTTTAINTSGADLLIIAISNYNSDPAGATVTDSFSNAWSPAPSQCQGGSEACSAIFYAWNPGAKVGNGHTVSVTVSTGNSTFGSIEFAAFSGSRMFTTPFDQTTGAKSPFSGHATFQPGSITPSGAGALIICALSAGGGAAGFSINSGFTILDSVNYGAAANEGGSLAYLVQTTAAAINPTWSITTTGNSDSSTIASFLPPLVVRRGGQGFVF